MILEIIKAILFGIVEGITEWLPISSTGHMILLEQFLKLNVSEEFWKMFLVVIQLGAILAVVDFMLYSFWFALLVFVIFMLYMTYVTIKTKEKVEVE